MTAALTVCVVIPARSRPGALRAAGSFAAEASDVVIVDNGAGFLADQELPDRTSILRPEAGNIGYGAAANLAASTTTADVLVVTNDDVVARPGCVTALAEAFEDPDVHHAGGVLHTVDGSVDSAGIAVDRTLRAYDVRALGPEGAPTTVPLGPSGAAAAYRRSTFLDLGGFAPELFAYWEDVDLALRLHARGARYAFVADALAVHERGSSLGGRSGRQRELDAFGRGFVLGRYAAWLGPSDRGATLLVDWPSLVRGAALERSLSALRARRQGRAVGRRNPLGKCTSPATRPLGDTLRRQWGSDRSAV